MMLTKAGSDSQRAETPTVLKTVDRALDVLEYVATSANSGPATAKAISDAIGHNLSSTYHIINTLLTRRYLEKDVQGNLRLGPKASELGQSRHDNFDILEIAEQTLNQLANSTGETVYLTRLIRGRVVIQIALESSKSLRVTSLPVGHYGSEDARASGIAVLAHLNEAEARNVLIGAYPKKSLEEISNRLLELEESFTETRESGYFFESEMYEAGVSCIAAPFFNFEGKVEGSISVSAPTVRVSQLIQKSKEDLLQAVNQVTESLKRAHQGL